MRQNERATSLSHYHLTLFCLLRLRKKYLPLIKTCTYGQKVVMFSETIHENQIHDYMNKNINRTCKPTEN